MSETKQMDTNGILLIVLGAVFGLVNVLIPLLHLFGGFLAYIGNVAPFFRKVKFDYYWDVVAATIGGTPSSVPYSNFNSDLFIWDLLGLFGPLYILGSIVATILILIPGFYKVMNQENPFQLPMPMSFFGMIIGLVVSVGEFLLFFLLLMLETNFGSSRPSINIIRLVLLVISWVSLVVAYYIEEGKLSFT